MKDLFYLDAVNEALTEEMARDDKVFIIGEDIAVGYGGGGVFGATRGLLDKFGEERVIDAPLSESATFTVTFDEDTELTGNMKLKLWVSTTEGTDMDLFVGIEKRDAQGNFVGFHGKAGFAETPAALGWLRVSERALDPERSTPAQPCAGSSSWEAAWSAPAGRATSDATSSAPRSTPTSCAG